MMRIFELNSSEISWIFIVGMILLAFSLRIMIELMDIKPKSDGFICVSYTHLTLPTIRHRCRSRWSPYH